MSYTFNEFPHTANYDSDLRELISLVRAIKKKVDMDYDEALKEFIMEKFDSLFAGIVYVPETYTLKMYLGLVGDGEHVYTAYDETMSIV